MNIFLYDTQQRRKVKFEPSTPGRVGMYVCGPTVYSDAHLGHAKAQVSFDVIRRFFEYSGLRVRFVSNITDVGHLVDDADEGEDKIARRASLEKLEPMEIADKYFWSYMDDMQQLNVLRPTISPRATGHIPEQIKLIEELIALGHAYESDGSVYFDVKSWPRYGELSNRKIDELEVGTREAVREEKRDPRDFALWKKAESGHLMRWESPWGVGFPGWHIECSAMSLKYLGEGFDIHGGGLDLQFPHHEAEIAQSEAAGHAFARYWMHNNLVTVAGGEKMSKSKGNFRTLKELCREWDPMVLRFLLVSSHYRSVTEFGEEPLRAATAGYARLREAFREVERRLEHAPEHGAPELPGKIEAHTREFENAMRDDFNTPEAVAALFNLTRDVNAALAGPVSRAALEQARDAYARLGGEVLGLFVESAVTHHGEGELLDTLMDLVLEARQHYRLNKQFSQADELRAKLTEAGVTLEDTPSGTRWKR
ncbi:cysteine--tRNA ligase [Deinococcus peraridilitoris]|uniref:Cysteine--tRNA ligase n=1 Tax=Deinococcus peraridilitoris (strain DSM 19664 / LMG 22246 / CIP 109416 / KR-200) TaxID=937777 RepID=L0A6T6_DEIPD|nr:cysteine--tRNA ligase [Deinococcus peraridilitoris]AFZ68745.1 cysteinyl-tRNA synthetase [Deinococcus peraridilitoris DSM 19664]